MIALILGLYMLKIAELGKIKLLQKHYSLKYMI